MRWVHICGEWAATSVDGVKVQTLSDGYVPGVDKIAASWSNGTALGSFQQKGYIPIQKDPCDSKGYTHTLTHAS